MKWLKMLAGAYIGAAAGTYIQSRRKASTNGTSFTALATLSPSIIIATAGADYTSLAIVGGMAALGVYLGKKV